MTSPVAAVGPEGWRDVVGRTAEAAAAALSADGWQVSRRSTCWRGEVPGGGTAPAACSFRVLAVRRVGERALELVVAGFSGGAAGAEAAGFGGEGG